MANNRICLTCGTAYEYCGSCRNSRNLPTWKNLFDTENCKDIFQTVSDYEQKAIDKTKAKKMLAECDLKNKKNLKENILKVVNEITVEKKEPAASRVKKAQPSEEKISD